MVIREELPTIRYYSRKEKYINTKEVITISTYIHFTKEQREQARRESQKIRFRIRMA
jgi:hypothetical protein